MCRNSISNYWRKAILRHICGLQIRKTKKKIFGVCFCVCLSICVTCSTIPKKQFWNFFFKYLKKRTGGDLNHEPLYREANLENGLRVNICELLFQVLEIKNDSIFILSIMVLLKYTYNIWKRLAYWINSSSWSTDPLCTLAITLVHIILITAALKMPIVVMPVHCLWFFIHDDRQGSWLLCLILPSKIIWIRWYFLLGITSQKLTRLYLILVMLVLRLSQTCLHLYGQTRSNPQQTL